MRIGIVWTQVQSLDDHPPSISVFANFTSFFNEGAVAALKYGVMPKIVSVMRAATDLTLRKHSTMTLRNILNNDVGAWLDAGGGLQAYAVSLNNRMLFELRQGEGHPIWRCGCGSGEAD